MLCRIEGCGSEANRKGAVLCEKHYARIRRYGTHKSIFDRSPERTMQSAGYVLVKAKGHPRSLGLGRAYEHRVVYQDAHGDGPFQCHWCAAGVTWDDMHVDHVDDCKTNNAVGNLVASCQLCNQARGKQKRIETMRAKCGLALGGLVLTHSEWAAKIGITEVALRWRLVNGWPLARALTQGRGKHGPIAKISK